MAKLVWNSAERPYYDGVDQAVIYLADAPAVPWNGLVSVEETSSGDSRPIYFDGKLSGLEHDTQDFSLSVSAYTYPNAFSKYTGFVVGGGVTTSASRFDSSRFDVSGYSPDLVANQTSRFFGMSYRVGDEKTGQIHLVYNAMATPSDRGWRTNTNVDLTLFKWDINTRPVAPRGLRPTAHLVVDLPSVSVEASSAIKNALYGTPTTAPYLPSLVQIFQIFNIAAPFSVTDNGNGTWTVEGPEQDVKVLADGRLELTSTTIIETSPGVYTMSTAF